MQVTSTGEAHTGERCSLCDGYHPVETASTHQKLAALGFRDAELDAIFAEQARMAHGYGVPAPDLHRSPSDAAEKTRERKRRSRAARKEAENAD